MKKHLIIISLLSAVVVGPWACSSDEDMAVTVSHQWEMTTQASKDSGDVVTRALFIGGASGKSYVSLWEPTDVVKVYKNGSLAGTLKPVTQNVATSELKGDLTGSFTVGESLEFYVVSPDVDYTGQTGSLSDMTNYAYMASTVKVASISGNTITTEKIAFRSRQFYLRFQFMDADSIRLPIEQLTIHTTGGKLLQSKTKNGTPVYGDIVVNTQKENGSYPIEVYVCMHNDLGAKDTYSFTVKSGGYIYASTDASNSVSANLSDGTYNRVARTLSLLSTAAPINATSSVSDFGDGGGDGSGAVNF